MTSWECSFAKGIAAVCVAHARPVYISQLDIKDGKSSTSSTARAYGPFSSASEEPQFAIAVSRDGELRALDLLTSRPLDIRGGRVCDEPIALLPINTLTGIESSDGEAVAGYPIVGSPIVSSPIAAYSITLGVYSKYGVLQILQLRSQTGDVTRVCDPVCEWVCEIVDEVCWRDAPSFAGPVALPVSRFASAILTPAFFQADATEAHAHTHTQARVHETVWGCVLVHETNGWVSVGAMKWRTPEASGTNFQAVDLKATTGSDLLMDICVGAWGGTDTPCVTLPVTQSVCREWISVAVFENRLVFRLLSVVPDSLPSPQECRLHTSELLSVNIDEKIVHTKIPQETGLDGVGDAPFALCAASIFRARIVVSTSCGSLLLFSLSSSKPEARGTLTPSFTAHTHLRLKILRSVNLLELFHLHAPSATSDRVRCINSLNTLGPKGCLATLWNGQSLRVSWADLQILQADELPDGCQHSVAVCEHQPIGSIRPMEPVSSSGLRDGQPSWRGDLPIFFSREHSRVTIGYAAIGTA